MSASRLATEHGVTRRTIERDIAALRDAGVPLYAEHGRTGGHLTLDEVGNVVVTLSPTEVTALLIALSAAGPHMPFADAGTTATKRLIDGLTAPTRLAVETLRQRVRCAPAVPDRPRRRIQRTVEAAVERAVVVNIDYRNSTGEASSRSVEAHGFYNSQGNWFLIGWCQLRNAGRIFRLDRIERATLTRTPVADRDLDETLGWIPAEVRAPGNSVSASATQ